MKRRHWWRQDLGLLRPGDMRNGLRARADNEPVMERLFQHRFGQGAELAAHSFSHLFITAMTAMSGDVEQAVLPVQSSAGRRVTRASVHLTGGEKQSPLL